MRNIVFVHGAWVDGSGWQRIHDIQRAPRSRYVLATEDRHAERRGASKGLTRNPQLVLRAVAATKQAPW